MKKTNESALVLFEFYLSKSGTPDYEYADERTAKAIEWTVRKVQDNRQMLQRANLYRTEKDKISTVTTIGGALISMQEHKKELAGLQKILDTLSQEAGEEVIEALNKKYEGRF